MTNKTQSDALAQECADYATSLRSTIMQAKLEGRTDPVSMVRAADLFERAARSIDQKSGLLLLLALEQAECRDLRGQLVAMQAERITRMTQNDRMAERIADLEAQPSRECLHQIAEPARGQAGFEAWWRDKYPSFACHAPGIWEMAMHHATLQAAPPAPAAVAAVLQQAQRQAFIRGWDERGKAHDLAPAVTTDRFMRELLDVYFPPAAPAQEHATQLAGQATTRRQWTDGTRTLKQDVLGAIHDYSRTKPEEDPEDPESWESWFEAAFDLLGSRVGDIFDEHAAPVQAQEDARDTERLDWLTFNLSGSALRAIGVVWSEHADARRAIDAARAAQGGAA